MTDFRYAALDESGLSARRAANVRSWFVVAQIALGPWRSRREVRPAALAARMGVSRWTEWRARCDAVSAGVIRDWSLPDPEARGYGRGAVRVVELAFVRTRAVTQKVAAAKAERATRAERRRAERAHAKAARASVATGVTAPNSGALQDESDHAAQRAAGERSEAAAGRAESGRTPDPELVERPRRRRFSAEYKLAIVREADGCSRSGEIGALLRREGLYSSLLTEWRRARDAGALEAAYAATPERFVRRPPTPPPVPAATWINRPESGEAAH